MSAPTLDFVAMGADDLDWVAARESELHCFPWTRGNFADSLACGHACWLMRENGRPAGYAVTLAVLDEVHLLNISVAREAQGRGLGRRLLEHLLEAARRSGARQFFLEVRPSNASASALYRRAGFI